jgi:hypothetical protein
MLPFDAGPQCLKFPRSVLELHSSHLPLTSQNALKSFIPFGFSLATPARNSVLRTFTTVPRSWLLHSFELFHQQISLSVLADRQMFGFKRVVSTFH